MNQEETFAMEEEDAVALLLSDQLMEEDEDESEIYEMVDEEDEDLVIAATSQPKYSDDLDASSFYSDEAVETGEYEDDEGLVQENPFEPVYPATAGLLFENDSDSTSNVSHSNEKGVVLEALSLDNILPAGSRRRRN